VQQRSRDPLESFTSIDDVGTATCSTHLPAIAVLAVCLLRLMDSGGSSFKALPFRMEKPTQVAPAIDFLHYHIIRRLPEVPRLAFQQDIQLVTFMVLPSCYIFTHKVLLQEVPVI
jgi:hypothetical protein